MVATDELGLPDLIVPVESPHAGPEADAVDETARRFDLVLFDMDGTTVDERSSWEWLHHHYGVTNEENWLKYRDGLIDDLEFIQSDIALWGNGKRIHIGEIETILSSAPIMPGCRELVAALHAAGTRTCILSGGLDVLARRVCRETGIEMYVANGVCTDHEGYLTGEGICYVEIKDKATPTRRVLEALGADPTRTASVGNSIYDAPMFQETGFSIAFNPFPDGVEDAAHVVVKERDMRGCIPHLLDI